MADKLTDDQKNIIRLIEKEAIKSGLDPDFALAVAQMESGYKHIPATDTSSTAFGPFQVNKPTAKTLGVDYDEMVKNPELAVRAGIQNLLSHAKNPKLEGDPARIIAAHHYGADSPFALTGDVKNLSQKDANYIASIGELLPSGEFPTSVLHTIEKAKEEPKQEQAEKPDTDKDIYGGEKVTDYKTNKFSEPIETGAVTGAIGTGLGSIYTAKAPAVRLAQRVGLLPGGKPISPTEAAELVEKTMTANTPTTTPKSLHGGENWQKSLTGISTPGAQMGKESLDLAKGMQSAVGIKGAPGFTGGMITEGGIILNPQDASAVQARNAHINSLLAPPPVAQPSAAQRVAQSIMGSSPVRGGLAGLGVGYNVQDAYNKFHEGDVLSGGLSTGAAGASALTLAPKLASKMNPLALGLTTASQVAGDLRRGDRQSAAESGLSGLAALFPRLFGPVGATLYSTGLNKDEARELESRRSLPPTITR